MPFKVGKGPFRQSKTGGPFWKMRPPGLSLIMVSSWNLCVAMRGDTFIVIPAWEVAQQPKFRGFLPATYRIGVPPSACIPFFFDLFFVVETLSRCHCFKRLLILGFCLVSDIECLMILWKPYLGN